MGTYKFKTVNIRGKEYVEVKERVKYFRQEKKYENWTIATEFPVLDSEQAVCKATIADGTQRVIATGHAHEIQSNGNINKTSYIENCETSAVGRALAIMGIGVDDSMASAGEVADAIHQQDKMSKPKPKPKLNNEDKANIMDSAVGYIKSATDRQKAYNKVIKKHGDKLTDKQKDGLKKFV
tara:strand:+ start:344 stop:886 length:543 start_codon:yes stop_codon:yes gene_type:complete